MSDTLDNKQPSEAPNEQYTLKYSDYFEYNSQSNSYIYRLSIENFNDNKTWPLDNCPNCKTDLKTTPTKTTSLSLGDDQNSKLYGCLFSLVLVPSIILFYYLKLDILVWLTSAILIFCFIFFYTMKRANTKPIRFYHCTKCNSLLFNRTPPTILVVNPPKEVFKKLEEIPGFKLK